jgi:hypothetical protein
VWITGTLGAVVLGGRILVMRHLRRVVPADAAGSGRMPQGPSMYEMEGPCFGLAWNTSYLAWSWNANDDGAGGPQLIMDYSGTPTPYGAGFRSHLQALADSR